MIWIILFLAWCWGGFSWVQHWRRDNAIELYMDAVPDWKILTVVAIGGPMVWLQVLLS